MRCTAALALTFALAAGPAFAAEPFLVSDLATARTDASGAEDGGQAVLGGRLFYRGFDPRFGSEPWSSDGTPEGTAMLIDLCPGPCGSRPADFSVAGGRLYFAADDGVFGREPWKSDGTASGTRLLRDVVPGPAGSEDTSRRYAADGERLYFVAETPERAELWTSDGSRAGTRRVAACSGCGEPVLLAVVDGRLFFGLSHPAVGSGPDPFELWTSDGTSAGTRRLTADCRSCFPLGTAGGRLWFSRHDPILGSELWTSDGTPAGTTLLLDACKFVCSGHPAHFAVRGDAVYFTAVSASSGSRSLFRSDGTREGTRLELDGAAGGLQSVVGAAILGDGLYFASGAGVYLSRLMRFGLDDGEVALVGTTHPGSHVDRLTAAADRLFFVASKPSADTVWSSDGAPGGARALASFSINGRGQGGSLRGLVPLGSALAFQAFDDLAGWELWRSDGSAPGTARLGNGGVDPGSSAPRSPTALGDRLAFVADADSGPAVFSSDGTAGGTAALGPATGAPLELGRLGDRIVFSSPRGPYPPPPDAGLWASDGSAIGTSLLDPALVDAHGFVAAGGRLFFAAADASDFVGVELWRSDGTPAGTGLVRDLVPGPEPSVIIPCCAASSSPRELTARGDGVLFAAAGAPFDEDVELWRSDGSEGGTERIADLCPGPCSSSPSDLVLLGDEVFFAADDGESGRELWASDGSAEGTRLVADLGAGPAGAAPHHLFVLAGRLFFFAHPGLGDGLWSSDGTPGGTTKVHALAHRGRPSRVGAVTVVGPLAFFVAANEATGPELWVSDGTTAGTHLLRDLRRGRQGSYPESLLAAGDRLLFVADDGKAGREVFTSDGTAAGTRLLADLVPGAGASNPSDLTLVGSRLYFSAATETLGREPWALDLDAEPETTVAGED